MTPASAGPATLPRLRVSARRALASWSWSGRTVCRMRPVSAGENSAEPHPVERGQRHEHPDLRRARQRQCGDRALHDRPQRVGGDHDLPAADPVGHDPAGQREERNGTAPSAKTGPRSSPCRGRATAGERDQGDAIADDERLPCEEAAGTAPAAEDRGAGGHVSPATCARRSASTSKLACTSFTSSLSSSASTSRTTRRAASALQRYLACRGTARPRRSRLDPGTLERRTHRGEVAGSVRTSNTSSSAAMSSAPASTAGSRSSSDQRSPSTTIRPRLSKR